MAIQNETYSPQHMSSDKEKWTRWLIMTIAVGILSFAILFAFSPLAYWASGQTFNASSWGIAANYLAKITSPDFVTAAHSSIWKTNILTGILMTAVPFLASMFVAAIFFAACPYKNFEMTHGDVRWATDKDIRRMEARKQIGINGGYVGILGKWHNGEYIRLIEPISVACSAPPGTGKCLGLDVPVMKYDGRIIPNGDVVVGDLLMGPDGGPRRVTAVNRGHGPMYRVTPKKGDSWTCNGDHILSLRRSKSPRHRAINPERGTILHTTVDEWLEWGNNKKSCYKGWRAAIDFPKVKNCRSTPTSLAFSSATA